MLKLHFFSRSQGISEGLNMQLNFFILGIFTSPDHLNWSGQYVAMVYNEFDISGLQQI